MLLQRIANRKGTKLDHLNGEIPGRGGVIGRSKKAP